MTNTIDVNQGYKLTSCIDGKKGKLAFVAGRQGDMITIALVSGLTVALVTREYGSEYAKVATQDGVYNLSPCGRVEDMSEVAEICEIIRNS